MASPLARPTFFLFLGVCLALGMAGGRDRDSLAQEGVATPATPVAIDFTQIVAERPVEIRSGSCAEPGEAIAALSPLTTPEGEAQGQGEAIEAERSYTSVPLAMESLLTGETNITVPLNGDEDAVVIACGEIGGVVSEGGSLVVKLSEQNDSGFTGIAYLGPEDEVTTGVSLFLAGELTVAETRELVAAATPDVALEPLPEPTPTAEPVQVADLVLFEWMIDMPAEVRAGKINFVVTNEGVEAHSVVIEGQGLIFELPQPLDPADTTILTAELPPGEYVVYCPIGEGEHRAEGMEGTLTVIP
jgi:plastocyanin